MKFTLSIDSGNAAFEGDDGPLEVARLLQLTATLVEDGREDGRLLDINGNSVGSWSMDVSS